MRSGRYRKTQGESATLADVVDRDASVMRFDDAAGDCETEAGSPRYIALGGTGRLAAKTDLEHALEVLHRDATALVDHGHFDHGRRGGRADRAAGSTETLQAGRDERMSGLSPGRRVSRGQSNQDLDRTVLAGMARSR